MLYVEFCTHRSSFLAFLILFAHPYKVKLAAQNWQSEAAVLSVGGGNTLRPHPAQMSAGLTLPTVVLLSVLWWGALGVPCVLSQFHGASGCPGREGGGE